MQQSFPISDASNFLQKELRQLNDPTICTPQDLNYKVQYFTKWEATMGLVLFFSQL